MEFNLHMTTQIFFGEGKISELGKAAKKYGKKVLIVSGKGSIKRNGVFNAVVEQLKENGMEYIELSGVDPNPRIETVREGAKICKEEKVDLVLAVGGGSTIDCAKGIAVAAKHDIDPWKFYNYEAPATDGLPLGVVLTLSATGSEMNSGSVITNLETKQKHGWGCEYMLPKFSILDPTYTYTVPRHQTACGVVDILTHIFEFYFTLEEAKITDGISESLMKTVIECGRVAMDNPTDYQARANLMWASSMALNGITMLGKSFEGFNHGVEHAISAVTDITHADGLAILAPHWMSYVLNEENAYKFAAFGREVWGIQEENDLKAGKLAIEELSAYYKALNMPLKLRDLNLGEDIIEQVVEKAVFGESIGNLAALSKKDVTEILMNCL